MKSERGIIPEGTTLRLKSGFVIHRYMTLRNLMMASDDLYKRSQISHPNSLFKELADALGVDMVQVGNKNEVDIDRDGKTCLELKENEYILYTVCNPNFLIGSKPKGLEVDLKEHIAQIEKIDTAAKTLETSAEKSEVNLFDK